MPKLSPGVVLALTICSYPLCAQPGSVTLNVCNKGPVSFNVFVSSGGLGNWTLPPGACSSVYVQVGQSPAAYLGIAFVDSTGKWGAAKKLDLLPDFGVGVLTLSGQSVVVPHGNSEVSLPMQLLFRPRSPTCRQRNTAVSQLRYNASASEKAYAESLDRNAPPLCENLAFSLNVIVYPESREITFRDEGEALPTRHREEWNHMHDFLITLFTEDDYRRERDKNIVIQGTIASFKLPLPGASELWTDVYFKESPDKAFNFCTSNPDIFKEVFGPNFATSMIGKTVQVDGDVTKAFCQSGAGIRVTLTRQLHVSDKDMQETKANAGRYAEEARVQEAEAARQRELDARQRDQNAKAALAQRQASVEASRRAVADFDAGWMGQRLLVKGTVSRAEVKTVPYPPYFTGPKTFYVLLYFKEAPAFVMCFSDNGVDAATAELRRIGGADFSGLVGKTVEGQAVVNHPVCAPNLTGMRVLSAGGASPLKVF